LHLDASENNLNLCEIINLCGFPGEYRLGATPLMELMIAAGKAVAQLQLDYGLAVERVYTGSFMTSLDMKGKLFWGLENISLMAILSFLC
jgi:hypothetical protein